MPRIKRALYAFVLVWCVSLFPYALGVMPDTTFKYVIVAFLIAYLIGTTLSIEWGVLIYLFLFMICPPTWSFEFSSNLPLISVTRLLNLILIFCFFLRSLVSGRRLLGFFREFPFGVEYFVYLLLTVFSVIFSFQFTQSLYRYLSYALEVFLISIIIFHVLKNARLAGLVLDALVLSVAVASFFGILELLIGHNYFSTLSLGTGVSKAQWYSYSDLERLGVVGRVQSLFDHPIAFGGFLAITFPYVYFAFSIRRNIIAKLLLLLVILLSLGSIISTVSRSPIFAIFIEAVIILFLQRKEGIKIAVVSTGVVLIAVTLYEPIAALLSNVVFFWTTQGETVGFGGSTVMQRIDMISNGIYYMRGHWISGYGFGGLTDLIQKGYFSVALIGYFENYWIWALVSSGITGLAGTIYLLFGIFRKLLSLFRRSNIKGHWSMATLTSLFGFLAFASATGEMGLFPLAVVLSVVGYQLSMSEKNIMY